MVHIAGNRCFRNKGFTLVEVLLVISIISLLAAILFPVFDTARRTSRRAVCLSNLRQIGMGIGMYAHDYDDRYPHGIDPADVESDSWSSDPGFKTMLRQWGYLHEVLMPYTKTFDIWHCPADVGFDGLDSHLDAAGVPYPMSARPSSFQKWGTSYLYRTSLALNQDMYPCTSGFELFPPYKDHGGANVNIVWDGNGSWHGGFTQSSKRFNTLMADNHVTSLTARQLELSLGLNCQHP
jgi:prepilin-type N-terminal cleavage/methylation domain-containing protein